MDDHFNKEVIKFIVDYYNKHLWRLVERSMPNKINSEHLLEYKEDLLYRGLELCYKHKDKFDPTKGKANIYFATILRTVVYRDCHEMKSNPNYKRLRREKVINEILNEDSNIESPNSDNTSVFSF